MNILRTIAAAFSMFSKIPMPHIEWEGGCMKYMMCAFPLVGAVIGIAACLWTWIAGLLGIGNILYAAVMTLVPVAVTGGIHLDGFCDTSDAIASRAPVEKKREILKDSHAGAFAVISLCSYMLLYFALVCTVEMSVKNAAAIGIIYILVRVLSGMSTMIFRMSGTKGTLDYFSKNAEKGRAAVILTAEFVVCATALIVFFGLRGLAAVLASVICFVYLKHMSSKQFGGMSGDLAGWFLQTAEVSCVAAFVIIERVLVL